MYLKYSYNIIVFYFLFSVVSAILNIWNVDMQYDKVLDIAILLIIVSTKQKKIRTIDYLIIAYMVYLMFTVLINDYPNKVMVTYYAIKTTWIPIMLFFVARRKIFESDAFYQKMIIPITISLIFGIIFFVTMPDWYVKLKSNNLAFDSNSTVIDELFRMSSFWSAPQFIGYSNFIFLTYLLYLKYISNKLKDSIILPLMILSVISLLLIQIRVAILGSLISLITFLFWDFVFNRQRNKSFSFSIIISVFIAGYFIFKVVKFVDVNFLTSKIESIINFGVTSSDRIDSMKEAPVFNKYPFNMWGYGMGRFSISVSKFNMPDLRDGGYLKELLETGYIGLTLLISIFTLTIYRLIKYFRYLVFEFTIMIFFIIALIGANAISESFTLNVVFWLNLGVIWNRNVLINRYNQHKFSHSYK